MLELVEPVPTFEHDIMFSKLEHSFDEALLRSNKKTLKTELTSSYGIDAARILELEDLLDEESEEEGEVMLLAMILLQLNGMKFPDGFPLDHNEANKKKRQRTSPDQLAILEQIFQTDKMPSQQTRVMLADQLGMSSRRVQIWFQNKRAKVKRGLGKSCDGVQQPPSPTLDIERESSALSSSSCLSEPSSPVVPDSFHGSPFHSSPTSSPSSAVVPSSPSFPQHKKLSAATKLQFSLSALSQPIMFSPDFSTMSALKGV